MTRLFIFALLPFLSSCGPRAQPERHLLPEGYIGRVDIVFGVLGAPPTPVEDGTRIYRIPASGILVTSTRTNPGWAWKSDTFYAYETAGGPQTPITGRWYSTIHDTAEVRQDKTVGIGGRGLGSGSVPGLRCEFSFQTYFVGRQAEVLNSTNSQREPEILCRAAAAYSGGAVQQQVEADEGREGDR